VSLLYHRLWEDLDEALCGKSLSDLLYTNSEISSAEIIIIYYTIINSLGIGNEQGKEQNNDARDEKSEEKSRTIINEYLYR
jgi:hypothetical protein